jgi:hypothetical protein
MGTSQSSPGASGQSPLVPPWADDAQQAPPIIPPARFKGFRQSLGYFVKTGDRESLKRSLKHYAQRATGGGKTASHRFSAITNTGATLYAALTGEQFNVNNKPIIISKLNGQPCEQVINTIVQALTPVNGDSNKIQKAINYALAEALEGKEEFDITHISADMIADIMISYLTESIFLQIVMDGGDAWKKAETPSRERIASEDLRELIKITVDQKMSIKFTDNGQPMDQQFINQLQKSVIIEVWDEWGNYT